MIAVTTPGSRSCRLIGWKRSNECWKRSRPAAARPPRRINVIGCRHEHADGAADGQQLRQSVLWWAAIAVIFRLILLSILIGVILEVLGLDPWNIIESLRRLMLRIWDMGFDAVRWLWRYLLLGAAVVVPIWLVVRLMRVAKGQ
jgi:hypothetical protein